MIRIYNKNEIKILRQGGRILAKIMEELKEYAKEQGYRVTEFVEAWNGWEIWARQMGKEWYEVKK